MPNEIDLSAFRAAVEYERLWREREIRFLKNQVTIISVEEQREVARKALLVMLYAHFEGMVKFILCSYIGQLNGLGLTLSGVHSALAAAALEDVFSELRSNSAKNRIFIRTLPDDAKLHRFSREREFLERAHDFGNRPFIIKADRIVDLESNLKEVVLMKNLYRLGLDPGAVAKWRSVIGKLVGRRNNIAHGAETIGVTEKDYDELEYSVWSVVDEIVDMISSNIVDKRYLASASTHGLTG